MCGVFLRAAAVCLGAPPRRPTVPALPLTAVCLSPLSVCPATVPCVRTHHTALSAPARVSPAPFSVHGHHSHARRHSLRPRVRPSAAAPTRRAAAAPSPRSPVQSSRHVRLHVRGAAATGAVGNEDENSNKSKIQRSSRHTVRHTEGTEGEERNAAVDLTRRADCWSRAERCAWSCECAPCRVASRTWRARI